MIRGFSPIALLPLLLLVTVGAGLAQWNGEIVAWGSNGYGACDVPEPNSGYVALGTGCAGAHSLGLKADGSIVAWGGNGSGQCDVPEPNSGFVGIGGGSYHGLGLRESTGIEDEGLAGDFIQIRSVSPNPFSSSTSVVFQSPGLSAVTFQVFDIAGCLVRTQTIGNSPAGQHSFSWDGRNSQGAELGSGVYFIRLGGAEQQASAKVVLVR